MKIVNEKGKLFGIINVVDLLILLVIVAVAGGVFWQLLGTQVANKVAPQVDLILSLIHIYAGIWRVRYKAGV